MQCTQYSSVLYCIHVHDVAVMRSTLSICETTCHEFDGRAGDTVGWLPKSEHRHHLLSGFLGRVPDHGIVSVRGEGWESSRDTSLPGPGDGDS